MPRLDHVPSTNWRPSEMRSCWGSSSYAPRVRRPLLHRKLRLALPEAAQSESIFQIENGDVTDLAIGWQAHQAAISNLTSVNRASQAASRNRPQQRERPINSRSLSNSTIERELDRSCKT